ncbi:hypothetical protein HQQ80_21710 [Microbacteriaceae bacterium VKM Ac-2855]|nr:hypothetical protein [Microbacteriaceae bacterium VKM Ac-2855]
MSNTTHEDKFIPSKQPNWFMRAIHSRTLPWFLFAIVTTAIVFTIFGWFLRSENMAQIQSAVAAASKVHER